MNYRMLGASDLRVSQIALGSWLTFGVGVERAAAVARVAAALTVGSYLARRFGLRYTAAARSSTRKANDSVR
jgi:predicted alpha/beta-hydrolase family hydrolase